MPTHLKIEIETASRPLNTSYMTKDSTYYLAMVGAWSIAIITAAIGWMFSNATIALGNQVVRFHKDVFYISGDLSNMAWIFQAMGLSAIIICALLAIAKKCTQWYFCCMLYSYLVIVGGGVFFVILIMPWLKSSMYL